MREKAAIRPVPLTRAVRRPYKPGAQCLGWLEPPKGPLAQGIRGNFRVGRVAIRTSPKAPSLFSCGQPAAIGGDESRETDVSTEQNCPQAPARLPRAQGDDWWTQGSGSAPQAR